MLHSLDDLTCRSSLQDIALSRNRQMGDSTTTFETHDTLRLREKVVVEGKKARPRIPRHQLQPPGFDLTDAQQLLQAIEFVRPWADYCVRQPVIPQPRLHRNRYPLVCVTEFQPGVKDFESLLRLVRDNNS